MNLFRSVALSSLVALIACSPAASPTRAESTLRARVLVLYRSRPLASAEVGVNLPGAATHQIGGSCTGSVVDAGILTAAHCTEHDTKLKVHTPDGKEVATKLSRIDAWLDVALLEPSVPLPSSLRIPLASALPPPGTPVEAFGVTRFGYTMFAGGTSVGRHDVGSPQYLVDMLVWPGLSGGPVVVQRGGDVEIIGVASSWTGFDALHDVRMLAIAPIDAVSDFLAGKPSADALAAAAFANAHREDTSLRINVREEWRGTSEFRLYMGPHAFRNGVEIDGPVSLTEKSEGNELKATLPRDGELEVPISQTTTALTVVASAPSLPPQTFIMVKLDNRRYLVPQKTVRFDIQPNPREKDDDWVDFSWSVKSGEGFEGHAVQLRAIVLHGNAIVGAANDCYYADVLPNKPLDCYDKPGQVWAPSGGTYDVVLMSGSKPIAYSRWEIPAP